MVDAAVLGNAAVIVAPMLVLENGLGELSRRACEPPDMHLIVWRNTILDGRYSGEF